MKKAKADYKYEINGNIIFIEDLDLGNKSVTNDIENILEDVAEEHNLELNNFHVIYRDCTGDIDGVLIRNNEFSSFYSIGEKDYESAVKKIKK